MTSSFALKGKNRIGWCFYQMTFFLSAFLKCQNKILQYVLIFLVPMFFRRPSFCTRISSLPAPSYISIEGVSLAHGKSSSVISIQNQSLLMPLIKSSSWKLVRSFIQNTKTKHKQASFLIITRPVFHGLAFAWPQWTRTFLQSTAYIFIAWMHKMTTEDYLQSLKMLEHSLLQMEKLAPWWAKIPGWVWLELSFVITRCGLQL